MSNLKRILQDVAGMTMLLSYHGNDEDIRNIRSPTVITKNCEKKKCKSCKHFHKDNYYASMCELTYKRKSPLDVACDEYIKRKK